MWDFTEKSRSIAQNGAMIRAVITITCKRSGSSFETEATTNTRCRRCRTVVRVAVAARNPNGSATRSTREHTLGIVLLSCGHPAVVMIHPVRSIGATLRRYDWECPDTGAIVTAKRVLTVLSEAEYKNLGRRSLTCSSQLERRARRSLVSKSNRWIGAENERYVGP